MVNMWFSHAHGQVLRAEPCWPWEFLIGDLWRWAFRGLSTVKSILAFKIMTFTMKPITPKKKSYVKKVNFFNSINHETAFHLHQLIFLSLFLLVLFTFFFAMYLCYIAQKLRFLNIESKSKNRVSNSNKPHDYQIVIARKMHRECQGRGGARVRVLGLFIRHFGIS